VSFLVGIAVRVVKRLEMFVRCRDFAERCHKIKASCGAAGHTSDMGASILTCWHNRLDDMTCLKPEMTFLAQAMAGGKAVLVCPTHLA